MLRNLLNCFYANSSQYNNRYIINIWVKDIGSINDLFIWKANIPILLKIWLKIIKRNKNNILIPLVI